MNMALPICVNYICRIKLDQRICEFVVSKEAEGIYIPPIKCRKASVFYKAALVPGQLRLRLNPCP